MKIFVTGGSGFVGGSVLQYWKGKHEIKALSRSEVSDQKLKPLGVEIVRGDLFSLPDSALQGIDVILHSAAFVGPWGTRSEYWQGNVEGTKRLVQKAIASKVKRLIHISTEATIFSGIDLVNIDETYPYPKSTPYLYSETKREAEKMVLSASKEGLETIVIRPRLVWGKGDTSVLPVLLDMVTSGQFMWLGGGKKQTSMTNIENLVHAIDLSLSKGKSGEVYFITDDEIWTYFDFLTAYLKTQNVEIPYKSIPSNVASLAAWIVEGIWRSLSLKSQPPLMRFPTDAMGKECTIRIDKARQDLGYKPVVSVHQGLQKV
ncbi:3-beta hydroxysteroid dehydrogenase/isomerase family protein [Leptospira ryugenii]|uniref:3-beta hydroxysteroid dehydrogenase/isomerase family protein n=1 Tax=Leptospira ryugenii TaxID=1917863 RepID=A0A2P2DV96_9LEPT|nr:NAD-dependent epimerase/dehydratase family protein [Leptospira ryugenii]GBF48535.1 3-beta hydroxysteroid dehydrogenase/isomerase family protein [Leptospira ryugenii]